MDYLILGVVSISILTMLVLLFKLMFTTHKHEKVVKPETLPKAGISWLSYSSAAGQPFKYNLISRNNPDAHYHTVPANKAFKAKTITLLIDKEALVFKMHKGKVIGYTVSEYPMMLKLDKELTKCKGSAYRINLNGFIARRDAKLIIDDVNSMRLIDQLSILPTHL